MGQFKVSLFQQARINTETFEVEAESAEAAKQQVISEHLADKEDAKTNGQFDVEVQEIAQQPVPGAEAPGTAEQPEQPMTVTGAAAGAPPTAQQPAGVAVPEAPAVPAPSAPAEPENPAPEAQ